MSAAARKRRLKAQTCWQQFVAIVKQVSWCSVAALPLPQATTAFRLSLSADPLLRLLREPRRLLPLLVVQRVLRRLRAQPLHQHRHSVRSLVSLRIVFCLLAESRRRLLLVVQVPLLQLVRQDDEGVTVSKERAGGSVVLTTAKLLLETINHLNNPQFDPVLRVYVRPCARRNPC